MRVWTLTGNVQMSESPGSACEGGGAGDSH